MFNIRQHKTEPNSVMQGEEEASSMKMKYFYDAHQTFSNYG